MKNNEFLIKIHFINSFCAFDTHFQKQTEVNRKEKKTFLFALCAE